MSDLNCNPDSQSRCVTITPHPLWSSHASTATITVQERPVWWRPDFLEYRTRVVIFYRWLWVWPLGAASRLELEFRGHEPRVLPLHYAAIYTAFCPDAANQSKKNRRIKMPFLVLGWAGGIRTLLYLVNSQVRNHYAKCPESGFYGKRGSEIRKNEIR